MEIIIKDNRGGCHTQTIEEILETYSTKSWGGTHVERLATANSEFLGDLVSLLCDKGVLTKEEVVRLIEPYISCSKEDIEIT